MAVQGSGVGTSVLSSVLDSAAVVQARAAEQLANFDLTVDRWRVLDLVNRETGLTMTGLASRLAVPSTTATRLVDHLVSVGALYRVVDHGDRRRVVLQISERGREILVAVAPSLHTLENELKATLAGSSVTVQSRVDPGGLRALLEVSTGSDLGAPDQAT